MLTGLEIEWGFPCPLVGDVVREFADAAEKRRWRAILLTGIVPGSRLMHDVIGAFGRHELRLGPTLRRWTASLEGGLDGYLKRRAKKLRENLRRAARRAKEAGVTFERGGTLDRAIAAERRSWKGAEGTGLVVRPMQAFYRGLVARLESRTRLIFARRGGEDVGYILGGVRDGCYRGFQFSYDERLRGLSLGGLLQLEQIGDLAAEGVTTYDMGIDLPYKRRWADGPFDTATIAVVRR
jgi:CelD/BcsL family acetyltransferase involved in cellulose biosynthesis